MITMQQVVIIHGGETFDSYQMYLENLRVKQVDFSKRMAQDWKQHLPERLGQVCEVIAPSMPCKQNAKYLEWKIWFEKFIPLLRDGVILIGHSLGGIFLVKYLSENTLPIVVQATFLVGAPCNTPTQHPIADFVLTQPLNGFAQQAGVMVLFHSHDDEIVPFSNAQKYAELLPDAHLQAFENRGHFNDETFPELEDKLRELCRKS